MYTSTLRMYPWSWHDSYWHFFSRLFTLIVGTMSFFYISKCCFWGKNIKRTFILFISFCRFNSTNFFFFCTGHMVMNLSQKVFDNSFKNKNFFLNKSKCCKRSEIFILSHSFINFTLAVEIHNLDMTLLYWPFNNFWYVNSVL